MPVGRALHVIAFATAMVAIGCSAREGHEDPGSDPSVDEPREPGSSEGDDEASTNPARPDEPGEAPSPTIAQDVEAPASGCVMGEPVQIWLRPGWVDLSARRETFVIAGTSARGETEDAFVVELNAGTAPSTVGVAEVSNSVTDSSRRAAPGLALHQDRGLFAFVDSQQRLLISTLSSPSPTPIAEGASLRFSPVLHGSATGYALVYTEEHEGAPMRVRGLRLSDDGRAIGDPVDLTPAGGGGAAPTFVGETSDLVFVDPRSGVSVVHRTRFTSTGFSAVSVARPVNLIAEPPELTAIRAGGVDWLGYTGIGSVATTAVGLMRLDSTEPPVALVPGTGYGVLHVDAAPLDAGAVFIADVPTASAPTSPRRLHLRLLNADGELSAPLTLPSEDGVGARGRIAVSPLGQIAVAFSNESGIYVALGRCASP